jgi:hypothetical protein
MELLRELNAASLSELLSEAGVQILDSSIADRAFFGAVVQRKDGQLLLAMPSGRSEFERDTTARMLLGEVLGISIAPPPPPLRMEVAA